MNNQGGRPGQFNRNANIHNEVNPHLPIRPVLHSSTSLTIGSDERLPDRVSRPDLNLPYQESDSDIVPNNESNIGALDLNISSSSSLAGRSRQMFPDRLQSNMYSSAEDVRNNHDSNLNLSLSLSSHFPSGSRGEGMDSVFSANTRVLPSKRRNSDIGGEILTGESSRRGVELGAQQLDVSSQASSRNNLTVSSNYRNQLASIHRSSDFEIAIGQGSVSNMQNQTQAATAPLANRLISNNYSGGVIEVVLPNQTYLFLQSDRSTFISSSTSADGATTVVQWQPIGYAPQQASSQIIIMSSRNNAPPVVLPHHYEQQGSTSRNVYPSNALEGQMQVSSETGNHSGAQELDLSNADEINLPAREYTHARGNGQPSPSIMEPLLAARRNRLMDEVRAAQQFLDAAVQANRDGILSFEQVMQSLRNMHNLPAHVLAALDEQNELNANTRLTEHKILKHIKRETFKLIGEETLDNKEACVICQEEYANGEEVGRLDCVHRFHINCIQQWLVLKNVCPICRQTALATDEEDDE